MKKKNNKNKGYFEGWYFKHTNGKDTFIAIPGVRIDTDGKKSAFLQILFRDQTHYFTYPYEYLSYKEVPFEVSIKKNKKKSAAGTDAYRKEDVIFKANKEGLMISLNNKKLTIKGKIKYKTFQPLKRNIMGPFAKLPFMECMHGVISANHGLGGSIKVNRELISFQKGRGYIETDKGHSFPKYYFWTQCSFQSQEHGSIMAAVAHIPICKMHFNGCIAFVTYGRRSYIFATYLGAKVRFTDKHRFIISQGKYKLVVDLKEKQGQSLKAPASGKMSRKITENIDCAGRYCFMKGQKIFFDIASRQAAFECVNFSKK